MQVHVLEEEAGNGRKERVAEQENPDAWPTRTLTRPFAASR